MVRGRGGLAQIQLSNFPRFHPSFPCQSDGKLEPWIWHFLFLWFILSWLTFLLVMRRILKDPSTQICPSQLKRCYDVIDRLVLNLFAAVTQFDHRRPPKSIRVRADLSGKRGAFDVRGSRGEEPLSHSRC